MAEVVSKPSTSTTVADKAAALTFLKMNYPWPKSIQFGEGDTIYNLSFVTNSNTGNIALNMLKPNPDLSVEHCGTAFIDAVVLAGLTDHGRTELIVKAAEHAIKAHIEAKTQFLQQQVDAINGKLTTVAEAQAKVQESQTKAFSGTAFAGLLGAIGALGAGALGGMVGGLPKELVEAQKLIQDLQNAQADIVKQQIEMPKTRFVCPKCGKMWKGAAPQKCPCGALVISSDSSEAGAANLKAMMKEMEDKPFNNFFDKAFLDNLKANTPMGSHNFKQQLQGDFDQEYTEDQKELVPFSMPKSVKDAMKKPAQATDDGFKDTSNDEQKFLQRVGMMSNLNVSIQGRRMAMGSTVYRAFCDKCKSAQPLEAAVMKQRNHEDRSLVDFCNSHRHISVAPSQDGDRKFKDV
jgi:rubrerythrin